MVPIDVYPWSPSLVSVAGVLGSKLTGIRDVSVVGVLWWGECVIVCGIPLVVQSEWVLIILGSLLLLLWACVIFRFLLDLLFYFAVVSLR